MFGAYAAGKSAGGYDAITDAARAIAPSGGAIHQPIAAHHATYQKLFTEYRKLHAYFGRGENDVMKRLREIRNEVE